MDTFDKLIDQILMEFNIEDRNDIDFYSYAVLFVQQLLQRNMLEPSTNVRETAMLIVKKGYYTYIDEDGNLSYKVEFLFDSNKQSPNGLNVQIKELPSEKVVKEIDNTHEESSIKDIVEFIESEQQKQQATGTEVPAAVGETPSEMPQAEQTPNTSKYLNNI